MHLLLPFTHREKSLSCHQFTNPAHSRAEVGELCRERRGKASSAVKIRRKVIHEHTTIKIQNPSPMCRFLVELHFLRREFMRR